MTKVILPYDKSPSSEMAVRRDWAEVQSLLPFVGGVKLGLEAMNAELRINDVPTSAALMMRYLLQPVSSTPPFLIWDQKIHDIGNTAANTVANLVGKVDAVTLHSSMSLPALMAVRKARDERQTDFPDRPLTLFGVTVLTDIDNADCILVYSEAVESRVLGFAERLTEAGIDGVVCSGLELSLLRENRYTECLKTLVPGIRPAWSETNDQKRIVTPTDAAKLGADYIVVGRPIMNAASPIEAAKRINEEVQAELCRC